VVSCFSRGNNVVSITRWELYPQTTISCSAPECQNGKRQVDAKAGFAWSDGEISAAATVTALFVSSPNDAEQLRHHRASSSSSSRVAFSSP